MNERLIQNLIFSDCDRRRHRFMTPNTTLFGWESDMIATTKAGLIIEYEIKISRGDFRADFKKLRHRLFELQQVEREIGERGPAYFYYVVPRDMVRTDEVPAHAGLIYAHPIFQIVKPAPRLHANKITDSQRQWLERSLIHRYWRERIRLEKV